MSDRVLRTDYSHLLDSSTSTSLFDDAYKTIKTAVTEHPVETAAGVAAVGLTAYCLTRGKLGALSGKSALLAEEAVGVSGRVATGLGERSLLSGAFETALSKRVLLPVSVGTFALTGVGCEQMRKSREEYEQKAREQAQREAQLEALKVQEAKVLGESFNTTGPSGTLWHMAQRGGKVTIEDLKAVVAGRRGEVSPEQTNAAGNLITNWNTDRGELLRARNTEQVWKPLNPMNDLDPFYKMNPGNQIKPWNYQTAEVIQPYMTAKSIEAVIGKQLKK